MRPVLSLVLLAALLGLGACQNVNSLDYGQYYLSDPVGKNIYRRSPADGR